MSVRPEIKNPAYLRAFAKTLHETAGFFHKAGAPLRLTGPMFKASEEIEIWAQSIEKQQQNNINAFNNVVQFKGKNR
jgi:TolB-like protein